MESKYKSFKYGALRWLPCGKVRIIHCGSPCRLLDRDPRLRCPSVTSSVRQCVAKPIESFLIQIQILVTPHTDKMRILALLLVVHQASALFWWPFPGVSTKTRTASYGIK